MALYNFGKNTYTDLHNQLDGSIVNNQLREVFKKVNTEEKYNLRVKKMIKTPVDLARYSEEVKLSIAEYIKVLIHIYPHLFNHHLIKYLKKNYPEFKEM